MNRNIICEMMRSRCPCSKTLLCSAGEPWTMQRQPPYTICIYPNDQQEFISKDVREQGQWRECKLLPMAVREGIKLQI